MNDVPEDDLRDALRRMSGAVRPTPVATNTIRACVRRSRRRRAIGGAVGTTGLVLAIVVGGYAVTGALPGPRQVQPEPATSTSPAPGELFECSEGGPVSGQAPPIADLERQEGVVSRLSALSSVQVRYAAPSPLGVVALVIDESGDPGMKVDPAVVTQLRELGAAHVQKWHAKAASVGMGAEWQVQHVLQWLLEPALRDVQRETRNLPGNAGLGLWQDAGAVVLQWKSPVPQEVLALAGVRPDGVEVIVESVDYSLQDVLRAQERVDTELTELGVSDSSSMAGGCGDGSGLIVGMVPPLTNRAELQADLTEALGLPVMVVPEEPAVAPIGGS